MSLKIPTQIFSDGNNTLSYGIVPWDSEIFGYNIYEVVDQQAEDRRNFSHFLADFEGFLKENDCRMVCVKIPAHKTDMFRIFQQNGYVFIEETIKPHIDDLQELDRHPQIKYQIYKAGPDMIARIMDIAYSTFTSDRYHMDSRFDASRASYRYAYWVNNSYQAGDDILYLDDCGKAAGFSIVSLSGEDAHLGLIGIDGPSKGRGLGSSLLSATCQYVKNKGVKKISTTVSLNNIVALNVYSRCGFRFKDPVYVMHKWL